MPRSRDLILVAGLAAALAVAVATYRALAGPAGLGEVLLGPPAAAIAPGLLIGGASLGYKGRSRLGAALGATAGAALAGLHAGLAASAGIDQLPVLAAGGLASGLAVYLGYRAILPPEGDGSGEGEPPEDEA